MILHLLNLLINAAGWINRVVITEKESEKSSFETRLNLPRHDETQKATLKTRMNKEGETNQA